MAVQRKRKKQTTTTTTKECPLRREDDKKCLWEIQRLKDMVFGTDNYEGLANLLTKVTQDLVKQKANYKYTLGLLSGIFTILAIGLIKDLMK